MNFSLFGSCSFHFPVPTGFLTRLLPGLPRGRTSTTPGCGDPGCQAAGRDEEPGVADHPVIRTNSQPFHVPGTNQALPGARLGESGVDRKSTRLNSSHVASSYAVFCLKKKKRSCCRRFSLTDAERLDVR